MEDIKQTFNDLAYPQKTMKTIKLKRYLRERGLTLNFTDFDIFIVQNSSKGRVDFEQFKNIIDALESHSREKEESKEKEFSKRELRKLELLQGFLMDEENQKTIGTLYFNASAIYQYLVSCGGANLLELKSFIKFCKMFLILPQQLSQRRITESFYLISKNKEGVALNQFIEIILLLFLEIYKVERIEKKTSKEFKNFLVRLDYSDGWEKVEVKMGSTEKHLFSKGI